MGLMESVACLGAEANRLNIQPMCLFQGPVV